MQHTSKHDEQVKKRNEGSSSRSKCEKRQQNEQGGSASKRVCTEANDPDISTILSEPQKLVGERVNHRFCVVEKGKTKGRLVIFPGIVTTIVQEARDPLYTLYEIVYDFDGAAVQYVDDDDEPESEISL